MARGVRHPAETRSAVIAAIMAGEDLVNVAQTFDVPARTVRHWVQVSPDVCRASIPKKRAVLPELVSDYLTSSLETLTEHAHLMCDPAWLGQLNARELALLHGRTFDRAFRILEAQ